MCMCVGGLLSYCNAETLLLHKWFHHWDYRVTVTGFCFPTQLLFWEHFNESDDKHAHQETEIRKNNQASWTWGELVNVRIKHSPKVRGQSNAALLINFFSIMWLCYSTSIKYLEIINWQRFLEMEQWFYTRGKRLIRPDNYRQWIKKKTTHTGDSAFSYL